MAAAAAEVDGVTVHDLVEAYPSGPIDVAAEQALVGAHDHVVFEFPLHWYSTPPQLKAWQDDVLTPGWAYNPMEPNGTGLLGPTTLSCAVTSGAPESQYESGGWNGRSLLDFLLPLAGTANFCGMPWSDPFVVYGVFSLDDETLDAEATRYQEWLAAK